MANMENSVEVPQKLKQKNRINLLLGIYSKKMKLIS
jgi:hypothetical protein